ncbi:MAG: site-specific integrase [bacterium]
MAKTVKKRSKKVATGIYRQADGSLSIRISTGKRDQQTGNYVIRVETFHGGVNEAKARRAELATKIATGKLKTPERKLTFGQYAEKWFEYNRRRVELRSLKNSTANLYEATIRRLFARLWDKPLARIEAGDITGVYSKLLTTKKTVGHKNQHEADRSIDYVLSSHTAFRAMWNSADDLEVKAPDILRPVAKMLPQKQKREPAHLSALQARKLLMKCKGEPLVYRGIVTACLTTAARGGEIRALRWSDIDFDNNIIIFKQRLYRGEFDELKTMKSTGPRPVLMTELLADILKQIHAKQQEFRLANRDLFPKETDDDPERLVFAQMNGRPIHYENFRNRWYKPFIERNGLPYVRPHGLRHSAATILRELGVDLKTVQEIVGHTRIETTADLYVHRVVEIQRDAMQRLEKALGG